MGGNLLGLQLNLDTDNQEEGTSPIARFQVFLGLLIFLSLNGHHLLISSIFQSFELIPIGELKLSSLGLEHIWQFSGSVFLIALKISAPVIITLFILDLLLGILSRTTPQSNLYSNFMPLRLGTGLLILALSFPVFKTIIEKLLLNTNSEVTEVLKNLK
jgi:flagellar biosynthetic protein FliR